MLLRKMLRAANFLLILAIVCVLAGAWWIIGRTAPKTSGTLLAPVAAEVLVTRDSLGIPHISARSIEDALFAQGYATAQDRLWQMDMLRRVAAGELSEVAGKVALELDTTASSHALLLRSARCWPHTSAASTSTFRRTMAAGVLSLSRWAMNLVRGVRSIRFSSGFTWTAP